MKIFTKAVLIIHGFAGGVYDVENISRELESNYDVFTFTLPGHDGIFKDKITHDLWIKKSEEYVNFILNKGYKKIYLIGHSMGGVIASYLATQHKEIKKLVLAAPAFEYFGFDHGKLDYESIIHKPQQIIKQYGFRLAMNRAFKLPLYCVSEFKKLVEEYYHTPKKISCPTLLIWGSDDNVVPKSSIEYVYNSLKCDKKIIYVNGFTHNLFREDLDNKLTKEIKDFFKSKSKFSIKNIDK